MLRNYAAVLGLMCAASQGVFAAEVSGKQILEEAIQQRYSWTKAHAKVTLTSDGRNAGVWDVYIDDRKVKGTTDPGPPTGKPSSPLTLCAECYTDNSIVRFQVPPDEDESPGSVSIYDSAALPTSNAWIPDPRSIGLTGASVFQEHAIHVDTYYPDDIKRDLLISDDEFDGRKCIHLSAHRPSTELDIWVDAERKTLLSVRLVSNLADTHVIDQVVNTYQQQGELWVLRESKHTRQDGNKQEVSITNVEFLTIGKSLPPDTFTLKSIPGLKPKAHVFWVMPPQRPAPFPDDALFWDGETIVRGVTGAEFPEPVFHRVGRDRGWVLWLNGVGVCAVILFLLSRRRHLKNHANNQPSTRPDGAT